MLRICSIDGCSKPLRARGLCATHWSRWRRGQSLTEKSVYDKTSAERFWERVDKRGSNDCWNWTGATRGNPKNEYGVVWNGKKNIAAHRFSYELVNGPIPKGMFACHKCDNTFCVNPKHIFIGTHTDNMRDKIKKGRDRNKNKTRCPAGHTYSKENTYVTIQGLRQCRKCHCLRESNRRAHLRAGG